MSLNITQKLWSWLHKNKIGDIAYKEGSPFIIGNLCHFLPIEIQTAEEKSSLKFCVWQYIWNGWEWRRTDELLLTKDKLLQLKNKTWLVRVEHGYHFKLIKKS
jgi:hypothetical protein